jgi:hypothetical protein
MPSQYYYVILKNGAESRFEIQNDESMEILMNNIDENGEGILFQSEIYQRHKIEIIYNLDSGYVQFTEVNEGRNSHKDIHIDFGNLFPFLREQVEQALRRLAKLILLMEIYKMADKEICERICQNHGLREDGRKISIISKTSERELNMTLQALQGLGSPKHLLFFSTHPSTIQKAIYLAFKDFQDQVQSKNSVKKITEMIEKYKTHDTVVPPNFRK